MINTSTGKVCSYKHLSAGNVDGQDPNILNNSFRNEVVRLAQGHHRSNITCTKFIFFIPKFKVPNNKQVTYDRIVCNLKLDKDERHRTKITVDRYCITYNYDISTSTAEFTTI